MSASFPASGTNKDITGTIEFLNLGTAVSIVSTGNTALHNFPESGPFLWHGITYFIKT
jgi:hypothetical protein